MERLKSQLNDKDEQLTICRSEIQHLEENLEQATAQLHKKQEELEEMTDFLQTTERQVHLQKQELEAQAKLKQANSRKLEGYEIMIKELKKSLAEAADDLKMQLCQLKERRMQRHATLQKEANIDNHYIGLNSSVGFLDTSTTPILCSTWELIAILTPMLQLFLWSLWMRA